MGQEFIEDPLILGRQALTDRLDAQLLDHDLVTGQDLGHLFDVVSLNLGRGIDRRQSPAYDNRREPHLQIGEARLLAGARKLQGHQKIARLTHAARETIRHGNDARETGPCGDTDMIETELPGILDPDRPAETHAACDPHARPARKTQVDELQEVLVPTDRDAVLGDAAEPEQDTLVEVLGEILPRKHRARYDRLR